MSPIVLSRPGKAERGFSKRGGLLAHRSALRHISRLAEGPSRSLQMSVRVAIAPARLESPLVECNAIAVHSERGPIGFSGASGNTMVVNERGEGYEVLHPGNVEFILRGYWVIDILLT